MCIYIYIFATVIEKDRPELAKDYPFPLYIQGLKDTHVKWLIDRNLF